MSDGENVQKKFFSLRSEADLIDAHERIINGLLNGDITPSQVAAISRLLKGAQYLISELPYRKLTLLAKLKVQVPEKMLAGFLKSGDG